MLRRFRRPVLPLVSVALLATLSACGSEVVTAGDGPTMDGFDAFSVSGELGTEPEISWEGQMEVDEIESKTLIEGDGPALKEGNKVLLKFVIGNGTTQETAYSSYGGPQGSGEVVTVDPELPQVFADALTGHTIGSRVAVISTAEEAFGELGNPQLGVGNKDTFVLVADLVSGVRSQPSGKTNPAPAWVPEIVEKDGKPTSLAFDGTPAPTDKLQEAALITGNGPQVEEGQTVVVNYLGQVYDGAKPFDESYSKDPMVTDIGVGKVVKGWDQGLVGQTVGSRVVLAIPPALGYGKAGNEGAGIKGTDTLYFVIDILSAG